MKELGTIGKIKISVDLKKHIDYLHKKLGSVEWSGILFFKHVSGDIATFKDLEFIAVNHYLMDIGTSAATEFDYGLDIIDAYEHIEGSIECLTGILHTHHSMGAFHSGTDIKELEDNADKYNYYISLVVDTRETYKCKIVFPSKTVVTYDVSVRGTNGEPIISQFTEEKLEFLSGDLEVELPQEESIIDWVVNRVTAIKEKKKAEVKTTYSNVKTFINNRVDNFGRDYSFRDPQMSMFNDELDMYSSCNYTATKEPSMTQFAKDILNAEAYSNGTVQEAVSKLKKMVYWEFENYLLNLEQNIVILHDNCFGSDSDIQRKVKDVITFFRENKNFGNSRVKQIVNKLDKLKEASV